MVSGSAGVGITSTNQVVELVDSFTIKLAGDGMKRLEESYRWRGVD